MISLGYWSLNGPDTLQDTANMETDELYPLPGGAVCLGGDTGMCVM